MPYTLLRVAAGGVVLLDQHAQRLAGSDAGALGAVREDLARLARGSGAGVYAVWAGAGGLRVERRGETQLADGMPARFIQSPFAHRAGTFPKPSPPCAYDECRVPGVEALLTSADGAEILESCRAAVLGWDGARLLCVPDDRPRVLSTAEAAVRENLPYRESPLPVDDPMPLLLVNAVKGPCAVAVAGRRPFPAQAIREVEALFGGLSSWGPAGAD